jgi:NAD(P)-dependent dehydrogenase (short-subunit alcohol dehydrogenase family)
MQSIVITGVSTGIGYGAAKVFIKKGYQVFGSVRKNEDANRLKQEFGDHFVPLIFDITDHGAIAETARLVKEKLAGSGLAGLINNAGTTHGSPLMHMPINEFRNNLEVLVVGQLAVIQAFLPLLGAQKNYPHKPGRIINITSGNGKIAAPFLGGYVSSKHAMEGLSNTLRIELLLYGIDVIIVGPGMVKTAIWDKQTDDVLEKYRNTDYYAAGKTFTEFLKKTIPGEGLDLDVFGNKLLKIFEKKHPKTRYAIAKNKFKNWTLPRILPNRISDKFFAKLVGIK